LLIVPVIIIVRAKAVLTGLSNAFVAEPAQLFGHTATQSIERIEFLTSRTGHRLKMIGTP